MTETLLQVRNLVKHFPVKGGLLQRTVDQVRAFAGRFVDRSPAHRRRLYRFCGAVMEQAAEHA